jgi:glycosyltransferase involved in cell wall biosynthesis
VPKLLNIAIPTYNRKYQLKYAIDKFIAQINETYEEMVDIFVSDDCSTDGTSELIREYEKTYQYIKYRRYEHNIGLERNLIESTEWCDGRYLWIFGDDDFLAQNQALKYILDILNSKEYEFIILNRSRMSFDLSKRITSNWMKLSTRRDIEYLSLRNFCKQWGIISIIGFISVNIFLREKFAEVENRKYFGIMYPQLGTMIEAFHESKCLLITKPLICHRTQTIEEKRGALGKKETEKNFMSDYEQRDALYFSFKLIHFLDELVACKAFTYNDLENIKEFVFSNTPLKHFIVHNIELFNIYGQLCDKKDILSAERFFAHLRLNKSQKEKFNISIQNIRKKYIMDNTDLSISVITPSYNQANYLQNCIDSVMEQTYQPIEHLIYDPGSNDGSIEIAKQYEHLTLISEKDNGQSEAVNKGIKRAKGDIIAWLNSDDFYYDETVFNTIVNRFDQADRPDIVYGKGIYVDEKK